MKLERDLVTFDIESTGLDTKTDRIIELCLIKITTDGEKIVKTRRFNPQIPISAEATEVHGISNEDVKDLEPFRRFAKGILQFIEDCDIAGFNSNRFDIPMLYNEFARAGIVWDWKKHNMVDAGNMHKIVNPRTLVAAYEQYTGKELTDAHEAQADVEATIEVLFAMVEQHEEFKDKTMEELALISNYDAEKIDINGLFTKDKDGDVLINFGKHKGTKAKEELGFIAWMFDPRRDFPADAKAICNKLLTSQTNNRW